jgi:hypothetical protein
MKTVLKRVQSIKENIINDISTKKQWSVYNVALSGFVAVVVVTLEAVLLSVMLTFINSSFGQETSGASPIIAIYFGIFMLALVFQFFGSLDACMAANTMQVAAVAVFNFFTVIYSIAQIFQTQAFKTCLVKLNTIISGSSNDPLRDILQLEHTSGCYFSLVGPLGEPLVNVVATNVAIQENLYMIDTVFQLAYAVLAVMVVFNVIGFWIARKAYLEQGSPELTQAGQTTSFRALAS